MVRSEVICAGGYYVAACVWTNGKRLQTENRQLIHHASYSLKRKMLDKHSIMLIDICKYTSCVDEISKIVASCAFRVQFVVEDAN